MTLRRRLFVAFALVAVPPLLTLAAAVLLLVARSAERNASFRLQSALQGGGGVSNYYNGQLARRDLLNRIKSQGTAAFTQGVQSTGSCVQFSNTASWADVPADVDVSQIVVRPVRTAGHQF